MNGELVPFLLNLLEDPLTECDKPSATKALIAESLKAMAKDLTNGEKVLCIYVCRCLLCGLLIFRVGKG